MSKKKDVTDYFRKIGYKYLCKISNKSVLAIRDIVVTGNSWVDTFKLERYECINIPDGRWIIL